MKKLIFLLLLPVFCDAQTSVERYPLMGAYNDTLIITRNTFEDSIALINQLRQERDYWKDLYYKKGVQDLNFNRFNQMTDRLLEDLPDSVGMINDSVIAKFYFFKSNDVRLINDVLEKIDTTPFYIGTVSEKEKGIPAVIDGDLYEIYHGCQIRIKTCVDYKYFKTEFPHFMIPKKVAVKFKGCK